LRGGGGRSRAEQRSGLKGAESEAFNQAELEPLQVSAVSLPNKQETAPKMTSNKTRV